MGFAGNHRPRSWRGRSCAASNASEQAKSEFDVGVFKKAAAYSRRCDVKLDCIAKHQGIWPAACAADSRISRGGFCAVRHDRVVSAPGSMKTVRERFGQFHVSDRTYGVRSVAAGTFLHMRVRSRTRNANSRIHPAYRRFERVQQTAVASVADLGERPVAAVAPNVLDRAFEAAAAANRKWIADFDLRLDRRRAGSMWRPSSISSPGAWSAGR